MLITLPLVLSCVNRVFCHVSNSIKFVIVQISKDYFFQLNFKIKKIFCYVSSERNLVPYDTARK